MEPKGWYRRGYLPHYDGGEVTQSVKFSLADSFPVALVQQWREELEYLGKVEAEIERYRRIEAYLDSDQGKAWLADPHLADMVQNALLYFADVRYFLHAWVVMPTHVHALCTPMEGRPLDGILHSWKSYTSNKANKYLRRSGHFWLHESFDRYIRSEEHFANEISYIENNPVKAGLCKRPEDWPWSSAHFEHNYGAPASSRQIME
jgi:REP element-mobilizing transposase RayT